MLGLASESVVAAVQATKKVRVHHSDRPVTSYDVRQNTGTVCQYATSTRARAHTHTHTHTNTHTQTHTHTHRHATTQAAWQGVRHNSLATVFRRSNPGGGRDFPNPSRPALGPTHPPIHNGYQVSFLGVKRPGVLR